MRPHDLRLRLFVFAHRAFLGSILSLALAVAASAQQSVGRTARAVRIVEAPTLDGLVNEEFWASATPAGDFTQRNPDEGVPATQKTEVRFAYDERNFYVGIICYDESPEGIVLTQNRRDGDLLNTDSVQILLDTFNDGQNAFIFGTTPTGIEYDA